MPSETPRSTSSSANPTHRSRGRRWLRRLVIAAPIAVALYTLFGFFGVPWLVRSVIVPRIGERLNGSISLERAAFNPFTFRLELERLEVRDDQGERVAALGAFDGNFEAWRSLVQTSWQFQSVRIAKPFLLAAVNREGSLNLSRLVKPSSEPATPLREIPRVVIDGMSVSEGEIGVRDASLPEPFNLDFAGLSFELTDLDTRPGNPNQASLRARTGNGAELEWNGFVESTPFASHGKVVARNVDLAPFMPYGLLYTSGRVVDGRLSFEAEYELAPVGEPPVAKATLVSADIVGLKAEHEDQPLFEAPAIHLAEAAVDFLARTLAVDSYEQTGGSLAVDRDADGTLAFVRILVSPEPRGGGSDAPSPADENVDPRTIQYPVQQFAAALRNLVRDAAGSWTVSIDRAVVSEHQLRLHDRSTPTPVETTVFVKAAEAGPILSTEGYAIPYRATIEPDGGGRLESEGTLALFDRKVDLAVKLVDVDATPYAPYIPEYLEAVRFKSARVSLDGTLVGSGAEDGTLDGAWKGKATVADVLFDDANTEKAILKVQSLGADGDLGFSLHPDGGRQVEWTGPVTLSELLLAAPSAMPLEATVATIGVEGTATVDRGAGGIARVGWNGTVEVGSTGLEAATSRTPVSAKLTSATAKGKLDGVFDPASAPTVGFDGSVDAGGIDLKLPQLAGPVSVAVGSLRAEGTTGVQVPKDAPLDLSFDGGIALAEVSVDAPERSGLALGASGARLEQVRFSESNRQVAAKELSIDGPRATATINALPKGPPPADAPPRSGRILELELPYGVIVDRIVLAGGTAEIVDGNATPPLAVQLESLAAELTNVNTTAPQATTIAVSSKLQGTGRLAVDGTADLLGDRQTADLTVTLAGVPLPPYDAVAGYYAGYKVDSGRLSSTMPIRIDGSNIAGELDFTFANIDLGDKVESPVAPDLPLDLGVSILKDSEGNVTGKVTFQGDMTSPSFSFGDLVFRAIFGLVGKIVTAPFQLLAGAFGGGDEDISFVAFEPGTTDLGEGEIGKLDVLAKALLDRAQLKLAVVGHATSDADAAALRSIMLREAMLEQLRSASPTLTALNDDLYRQGIVTRFAALPPPSEPPAAEPTFEEMEAAVLATVDVPVDVRIDLAKRRADRVAKILLDEHGLPAERVSTSVPEGDALDAESPRVSFELK